MYCINCGIKLPDGAKFCLNCGTSLASSEESKPSSAIQSKEFQLDFQEEEAATAVNKSISCSSDDDFDEDDEEYNEEDVEEKDIEDEDEDTEDDQDDIDNGGETDNDGDDSEDENEAAETNAAEKKTKPDRAVEKPEKNPFKKLAGLSIHAGKESVDDKKSEIASSNEPLTPANDPYWDDVLPEINDELYQIPKDTIAKAIGIVVAVAASIAWLIFMLPNF